MTDRGHSATGAFCARPQCFVADNGTCVDGLGVTDCPHYGERSQAAFDIDDRADHPTDAGLLALPGADVLTLVEAPDVLRHCDTRVLAIVGPRAAGKTSLIVGLYDLFQEGPVMGMRYAESRTLHAFERACHDIRSASRRKAPDMFRTPIGEVQFYHLALIGDLAPNGVALLLGDRAGEVYDGAAVDKSVASRLSEVQRADTLTVLVDGERLRDHGARHSVKRDILMTLQGLLEGGALSGRQYLALVLTKVDLFLAEEDYLRTQAEFRSFAEKLKRTFGSRFLNVSTFEVAATPTTVAVQRGYGIAALLAYWIRSTPSPIRPESKPTTGNRLFAHLLAADRV